MAGEVASTVLSRLAVPVLFYMVERKRSNVPPATIHFSVNKEVAV